jgi:acetate kinase
MGGIDAFVFTAGIGENAPAIREAVAGRLSWLGLELDPEANAKGAGRISHEGSRVACYVIPTDEELMIARHTLDVLRAQTKTLLEEKPA